jgi:hypothetical protein
MMKIFLSFASLLFAFHAPGHSYAWEYRQQGANCKGEVHGIVFGQDGKPWSGVGLVLEPTGDFDYLLPRTKSDEHGQYRFEEVPCGEWGVYVEDKDAGYPRSGRYVNWFLYGIWSPKVKITEKKLEGELDVIAPPRPGIVELHVKNASTRAEITRNEVRLKVSRKRWMQSSCDESEFASCENSSYLVPPNQNVILHIKSPGFREWKESAGHGKLIHLSAGEVMKLEIELTPVQE